MQPSGQPLQLKWLIGRAHSGGSKQTWLLLCMIDLKLNKRERETEKPRELARSFCSFLSKHFVFSRMVSNPGKTDQKRCTMIKMVVSAPL